MTKINPDLYRKLLAQAEEAEHQGMTKLASDVKETIGNEPDANIKEYSYTQMEHDIHRHLWKVATHVMKYYNVSNADIQKLDNGILLWASELIGELEENLEVNSKVKGPFEPKLPGEDK